MKIAGSVHHLARQGADGGKFNLIANSIIREIISSIHMLLSSNIPLVLMEHRTLKELDRKPYVFYEFSSTIGENLAKVATDVLLRLNLPLSGLRGQTYDGAANMSDDRKGAQARIREMQPLTLYVDCGAHCVNLATQAACTASLLTSDALEWVNKFGCLFKLSGKYKTKFVNIATAASGTVSNL